MKKYKCCYWCQRLCKCTNDDRLGKLMTFYCKDFARVPNDKKKR